MAHSEVAAAEDGPSPAVLPPHPRHPSSAAPMKKSYARAPSRRWEGRAVRTRGCALPAQYRAGCHGRAHTNQNGKGPVRPPPRAIGVGATPPPPPPAGVLPEPPARKHRSRRRRGLWAANIPPPSRGRIANEGAWLRRWPNGEGRQRPCGDHTVGSLGKKAGTTRLRLLKKGPAHATSASRERGGPLPTGDCNTQEWGAGRNPLLHHAQRGARGLARGARGCCGGSSVFLVPPRPRRRAPISGPSRADLWPVACRACPCGHATYSTAGTVQGGERLTRRKSSLVLYKQVGWRPVCPAMGNSYYVFLGGSRRSARPPLNSSQDEVYVAGARSP